MRRRLVLTLPAAAVLLGSLIAGSPAVAAQNPPMQAHGRGVYASQTLDDGTSIGFSLNQATNHQPGGAPTDSSMLWIERFRQSCDTGDYPDGTNTCTFSATQISLFPVEDRAVSVGPALGSAALPTIRAPYQQTDCTDSPGAPEICTDSSGVTDVTANFTATGPLDNNIYQERYLGSPECRSTLLSSSRGRPAAGTVSFLGSTYSLTARIAENVDLQRNC